MTKHHVVAKAQKKHWRNRAKAWNRIVGKHEAELAAVEVENLKIIMSAKALRRRAVKRARKKRLEQHIELCDEILEETAAEGEYK